MALGVPYQVHFTDSTVPGKESFIIQPGTTDGPLSPITNSPDSTATTIHTSLVLPGMGLVEYGQRVAESLVHLLEHFASATSPVAQTIGQLWYDTGNQVVKVWDGAEWAYIGTPWLIVASTDEYNAMVNLWNLIAGTASGTGLNAYGYGQMPMATITTVPVSSDWQKLYNNMLILANHQGTSTTGLSFTDFRSYADPKIQTYGLVTLLNWYQIWLATLTACQLNRFNVNPTTLESMTPTSATSTRTSQWNTTLTQTCVYTFIDDNHMREYFNASGSVLITPAINSSTGAANGAWNTLFSGVGTITLNANTISHSGAMSVETGNGEYTNNPAYVGASLTVKKGAFYALYTAGDNVRVPLLYAGLGSILASFNGVTGLWVYGTKNSAAGTLTLTVQFVDSIVQTNGDGSQSLSGSPGVVGDSTNPSTITSVQSLSKPSTIYLDNPEVPYPICSATALLSQGGYVSVAVTTPPALTIQYPSTVTANQLFTWSITGGAANDTWYADVSWAGGRIPSTGTYSLGANGSAVYTNGTIPTVGSQTITWHFGDGATVTKTVNVVAAMALTASSQSFNITAPINQPVTTNVTINCTSGSGSFTVTAPTVTGYTCSINGQQSATFNVSSGSSVTVPLTVEASSVPMPASTGAGTFVLTYGSQTINIGWNATIKVYDWTDFATANPTVNLNLAQTIALELYMSDTYFGNGNYGLYRLPDVAGLVFYTNLCTNTYAGNAYDATFVSAFFGGATGAIDSSRKTTANKPFYYNTYNSTATFIDQYVPL